MTCKQNTLGLAFGVALLSTPLYAQDDASRPPESLTSHLASISLHESFIKSNFVDLDGNGVQELVVLFDGASENPSSKEWRVLADNDGTAASVGLWYGEEIEIVDTQPAGSNLPPRYTITSDGSYWTLYKNKMRVFGDLVSEKTSSTYKGDMKDVAYFEVFDIGNVNPDHIMKTKVDFSDARGTETVMSLGGGDAYWREADGATPYVLLSEAGDVIHSGWSFMAPAIYKWPGGDFQIIERVNMSYEGLYFE